MTSRASVALLGSLAAAACSLMRLGEFDAPPCTSNADCAPAIRAAGQDPERCSAYVCNYTSGFCEPATTHGGERCDGSDNDCDGFVDEDVVVSPLALEPANAGAPSELRYAFGPAARTYVVVRDAPGGEASLFVVGEALTTPLRYEFLGAGGESGQSCPKLDPAKDDGGFVGTGCNISDASLSVVGGSLIYANVNTLGHACGQLRIGISSDKSPARIRLGPIEEETIAAGSPALGVDAGIACADRPGVSSPAIAGAEVDGKAQALAVWLATDFKQPTCDDFVPCEVRALGVFETADSSGGLNTSNSGDSIGLGMSRHAAAPAVVAISRVSAPPEYLVAFAASDEEGVLIQRVRFDASADGTAVTQEALRQSATGVGRTSFSLPTISPHGSARIGLAWHSSAGSALGFSVVSSNVGEPPEASEVLSIPTGNVVRGPEVIRGDSGFSVDAPRGGWFVFWEERTTGGNQRLSMARIAERTLQLLGSRVLAEGSIGPLPAWFPHLPSVSSVQFGIVYETESNDASWLLHSATCSVSD